MSCSQRTELLLILIFTVLLDKLNTIIYKKHFELANLKAVVICHDSAMPQYTSFRMPKNLLQLGQDVLSHPLYYPDFAPYNFHLLQSLQNSLNELCLNYEENVKRHLYQFFAPKESGLYERGILDLSKRWQTVLVQNGNRINY